MEYEHADNAEYKALISKLATFRLEECYKGREAYPEGWGVHPSGFRRRPQHVPEFSCTIDGKKIYVVCDEHIDPFGNFPEYVCQDADEIHLFGIESCSLDGSNTYLIGEVNLPYTLKCFRMLSNRCIVWYPHTRPTPKTQHMLLHIPADGERYAYSRIRWSFDEIYEYFIERWYPKMKIPYGCRVFFGDREIL